MTIAKAPSYQRIYVWELPVRAFHWVNGFCILCLGITGYLIGRPFTVVVAQEASFQYWFGTVRFLHFAAGYIFLINMLARTYWGFVGNKYANWKQFIPTSRKWFKDVVDVLKVDILQTQVQGRIHVGHNRLAGFIYFLSFWVYAFQAVTGFALYASMSPSWVGRIAAALAAPFGNDMGLRQWHHAGLWFFVVFTLVHVYLVFYHDYVEGRGTTSSMVGGWKFEREDLLKR
jgi:Ni/Fe-hydrogenase 1 B-type cytochrome subunit